MDVGRVFSSDQPETSLAGRGTVDCAASKEFHFRAGRATELGAGICPAKTGRYLRSTDRSGMRAIEPFQILILGAHVPGNEGYVVVTGVEERPLTGAQCTS